MPPIKSTKYISSKVKNTPVITCYEPYISCTHKPCFAVEIFFYYLMSERGFEEKRYYDHVTVYAACSSPKEAVDYAMENWETVVKNRNVFLRDYDLHFVRVSCVYVKIKDDYWKYDKNNKE